MESSRNSLAGPAGRAVLTAICLLAVLTPSAGAALPFRLSDLFAPRPAPAAAPVIAPVAEPITVDPVGPVQGTMIMVHAGGWAGHDASAQRQLVDSPGDVFLKRGWRIISIDYNEGTAGLQDVLNTAGAELTRKTGDGPVCIYGESSGAHLALAVAARLRAIDCVAGLGTPTDIGLYQQEAAASSDLRVKQVAGRMGDFFGATPDAYASWNPVTFAATIHADMLLLHEADDEVVTALHGQRFQAAAPATQLAELEPGDPNDETTDFMHGTISEVGRTHYASALGSFADRAVIYHDAERAAARTACPRVSRSVGEISVSAVQTALRCLARLDASARTGSTGGWQGSTVKLRGAVNAARIWSSLRSRSTGRAALAAVAQRRAKITVQTGERSRVTLRRGRG